METQEERLLLRRIGRTASSARTPTPHVAPELPEIGEDLDVSVPGVPTSGVSVWLSVLLGVSVLVSVSFGVVVVSGAFSTRIEALIVSSPPLSSLTVSVTV